MMLLDDAAPDTFEVDDDLVKTIDDYLMMFLKVPLTDENASNAEIAIGNMIVAQVSVMIAVIEQDDDALKLAAKCANKWIRRSQNYLAANNQAGQPSETS